MKILQRIISALNPTEEGTEPVDLADAAWLAAHLWRFSPGEDSVPADAKTEIESAEHRQPPDSDRETEDLRDQEQVPDAPLPETGPSENFFPEDRISSRPSYEDRSFEIHLPRGSEQDGKLRFICPAPPALTDTDKLAMALRPLKQIVLSHAHYVIDEDATVESIAEEGFWEPVLRFKPERRFDIALVVEKSLSMIFWHNVVTELKQLLIRQGIFRDVRVWSLIKDVRDESGLGIVPGLNQKTGRRSPSAITDITGRRLILVVSDCVSESWYEGRMAQQISKWSRYGSVALLQVLPEQMWERTGLGSAIPIRITSQSVGGHHSPYNAETLFGLSEDILNDGAMLPIATIEPEPVKRLVEMIASAGDQSAPGFCLASNLTADGKRKSSKTQTSEEQLDEFLDTASPNSYQLAVMLAAAPRIRLPIIRLIRASMLRDASHTHELEFLLSGLVKVIGNGADRSAYPDEIDFDFIPGVREELLDHLSVAKARQVLEAVSVYVEEHLGEARGFASVIADPSQGDLRRVDELGEAFARVAASVLGRLGGRYDGLLDQLKYKETFSQTINQMLASAMEKARSLESDYLQNRSNLGYLNKAIEEWESILNHPDFDDVGQDLQFRVLYDSAGTYFLRYEKTHSLKYLDFALLCLRKSLENIHSDSSKVPLVLESLAIGLRSRYSQTGELRELEDSIDTFGQAVSLTSENSSGLPKLLNNLGSALTDRYFSSNNLNDLENAIDAFKKAEKLSPENSSEFYDILSNLGNGLINRYNLSGDLKDLENALATFEKILSSMPEDSPDLPARLSNLGNGLISRYMRTGDFKDLGNAITAFEKAISFTPEGSPDLPDRLNSLGNGLINRYYQTGELNDLENAIATLERAISLIPENSSELPSVLNNLGIGLTDRYNRTGNLKDLESAVEAFEKSVNLTPENSPDLPRFLSYFGNGLKDRYARTGELKDLENAIQDFEQSARLSPEDSPDLPHLLNNLGSGLRDRYARTSDLSDLEAAIAAFEKSVALTPDNSLDLPRMLADLGNGLRDSYARTGAFSDLEAAIAAFEKSVSLAPENSPGLPRMLANLGNGLRDRYARTGALGDLEAAIAAFEKSVSLTPENYSPGLPRMLADLGNGLRDRYARTGALSDLGAAIAAFEKSLSLTPENSPGLPRMLADLGNGLRNRYVRSGDLWDLEAAIAAFEKSVSLTPENSPGLPRMLADLGNGLRDRYARTGALSDLEASIAAFEKSAALTPENSPELPRMLADLGNGLRDRYARSGVLSDLEASIAAFEKSVALTPENSPELPRMLADLGNGLRDRYVRSGDLWDLEAGIEAYEKATKRGLEVAVEEALRISCNWLRWAFERREWKEAKQAYTYTYQAGERLFRIQLLREQKESFLKETQGLAALGAYSLAKLNRMPEAVLASDSGQARLLSEALALDRAYLSNLEGTNHASLVTDYRESVALHQELIRRLGEVAPDDKEQQNVLYAELKQARMKMDETIETIRQISGYEDFLSAPEFEEIQDAARDHPLVYIMSTTAGGLSIIVKDDVTPVWLPELTENKLNEILIGSETEKLSATKLEKILKGSEKEESLGGYLGTYLNWRNANTSSTRESAEDTWFKTLEHTTKWLWQAVMEPLTKAFPSDSRVTLIPVGHLNLLPLHAAWTEDHTKPTGKRYALDTIIISYSPNARYLISAQNIANSISSETLLVVDDPSPVKANRLPNSTYEVEAAASLFPEEKRRILRHEEATRHAVLEAINDYTVLHFSCHGSADFNNPLNSCLLMANDERFTIKDLLGLRLKGSRLAVLSASETSIIGLDLPDEVVSLSAGMLQAGAAGVVASLWSPYDLSTAFLMMYFYDIWRKKEIEPVEALRQAQIWMRDTTSREKAIYLKEESNKKEIYRKVRLRRDDHFEHPCHWAVFGYMGV